MAAKADTSSPKPQFESAFNLFKPSIEVLKRNIVSILLFMIVPAVLIGSGSFAAELSADTDPSTQFNGVYGVLAIVGSIITLVTMPALIIVQTRAARKQETSPDDAFSQGLRYVPRLIGLLIVMTLILTISLLLLVVPFFFMLRRYILAPYYLVDQNLGILTALKTSAADSKKYSSAIWGYIGVEVLIALVGIVPLIGSLASSVAGILYTGAPAIRYEQIKAANAGKKPVAPIESV